MPDLNSLGYWYPLIQGLVATPKTTVIHTGIDFRPWLHDIRPQGLEQLCAQIEIAVEKLGGRAFLRTGHTSGKHDYRDTCRIESADPNAIEEHVRQLHIISEMTSLAGLPCNVWAVRERLNAEAGFTAFQGLPIAKEVRILCARGEPMKWQHYWSEMAIQTHDNHDPELPMDWRERLNRIRSITRDELAHLRRQSRMACSAKGMKRYNWSIDWVKDRDFGWMCVDMALDDMALEEWSYMSEEAEYFGKAKITSG